MRVVPALDEVEDCHAGFDLCAKRLLVESLALKRGKEALAHRVVVAVATDPIEGRAQAIAVW